LRRAKPREGKAPWNADVPVGIFPFVADEDVGVPMSLALPSPNHGMIIPE